jgi:hypothetical protein
MPVLDKIIEIEYGHGWSSRLRLRPRPFNGAPGLASRRCDLLFTVLDGSEGRYEDVTGGCGGPHRRPRRPNRLRMPSAIGRRL